MISPEDRALAEETFDFIERSTGQAPALMSEPEARKLRADHDSDAKALSRETKAQLVWIAANRGVDVIHASKQELVSALLEARYPLARLNEAIHVLHHVGGLTNSACEHCIERSEASGNSYEANLPIGAPDAGWYADWNGDQRWWDGRWTDRVSMALAEHTASAIDKIERAMEICPLCLADGTNEDHESHHVERVIMMSSAIDKILGA